MLLNLNKQSWMDSMSLEKYSAHCAGNEKSMEQMLKLAKLYTKVEDLTQLFIKPLDG